MTAQEFANRFIDQISVDKGDSSFGQVYKAKDVTRFNKEVAIKIYFDKDLHKYNLRREAELGMGLDHKNICKYFEFYEFEIELPSGSKTKQQIVVMEYCSEGRINDFLATVNDPIDKQVLTNKLLIDILEGLHYLHSTNHIHRDIKPANILVHKDNLLGDYIAKICDFGVSKNTGNSSEGSLTIYNYRYSSLEQIKQKENVSSKTDIWSFGVTMFELLAQKKLFPGNTDEVLKAINDEHIAKCIDELNNDVYRKVLEKCLVIDHKNRTATAGELIDILRNSNQEEHIEIAFATVLEQIERDFNERTRLRIENSDKDRIQQEVQYFEQQLIHLGVLSTKYPNYRTICSAGTIARYDAQIIAVQERKQSYSELLDPKTQNSTKKKPVIVNLKKGAVAISAILLIIGLWITYPYWKPSSNSKGTAIGTRTEGQLPDSTMGVYDTILKQPLPCSKTVQLDSADLETYFRRMDCWKEQKRNDSAEFVFKQAKKRALQLVSIPGEEENALALIENSLYRNYPQINALYAVAIHNDVDFVSNKDKLTEARHYIRQYLSSREIQIPKDERDYYQEVLSALDQKIKAIP